MNARRTLFTFAFAATTAAAMTLLPTRARADEPRDAGPPATAPSDRPDAKDAPAGDAGPADQRSARQRRRDGDLRRGTLVRVSPTELLLRVPGDGGERDVVVPLDAGTRFKIYSEYHYTTIDALAPGVTVRVERDEAGKLTVTASSRTPPAARPPEPERRAHGDRPRESTTAPDRPSPAPGTATPGPPVAARPPAGVVAWQEGAPKRTTGTFVRREAGAIVLTVGDAGRETFVNVDDETQVRIDGAPAAVADLAPGMSVAVIQVDGLTRSVEIRLPKKPVVRGAGK